MTVAREQPAEVDPGRLQHTRRLSFRNRKKLADDLNSATAEFMRLERIAFDIRQVPASILPPDGPLSITQAGKRLKCAFERYQIAVKRYRDFVDHGIMPQSKNEPGAS